MALATTDDVAAALGRALTEAEEPRSESLLETASAAVEMAAGGYRFAPGEYVVTRVPRRKVRIPAKVDSVESVTLVDDFGAETVLTAWTLRGSTVYGVLPYRASQTHFDLGEPCSLEVEIAFTVTEDVPAAVVSIVAGIVAATISAPPVGATSEGAGPFSISYADSSGRVWLSTSDRAILAKYRTPRSAIELGR